MDKRSSCSRGFLISEATEGSKRTNRTATVVPSDQPDRDRRTLGPTGPRPSYPRTDRTATGREPAKPPCPIHPDVTRQYLTLHPYGVAVATLTGRPAIDSSSAARTKFFAVFTSSGFQERLSSMPPAKTTFPAGSITYMCGVVRAW